MRNTPFKFTIALIILVVFFCNKNDATYTIEYIEDVKYIHNHAPLWGDEPKVTLEFVQKIGDPYSKDEAYRFKTGDINVDEDGNIYVIDRNNKLIKRYSPDGKFLDTIDIKKKELGEVSEYLYLDISKEGILYINDSSNYRIIKMLTDGTFLDAFTYENRVRKFVLFSTGDFIALPQKRNPPHSYKEESILAVCNDKGNVIRDFGNPIDMKDLSAIRLFSTVHHYAIDENDNVYASFDLWNRVDKYKFDGTHIFSADRPLNYEPIDSLITDGVFVESTTISNGVEIDHKGRAWVTTAHVDFDKVKIYVYLNNSLFDFHIFDPDGIFLGSIPMPLCKRSISLRIFGTRLFLFVESGSSIFEYKIVEK